MEKKKVRVGFPPCLPVPLSLWIFSAVTITYWTSSINQVALPYMRRYNPSSRFEKHLDQPSVDLVDMAPLLLWWIDKMSRNYERKSNRCKSKEVVAAFPAVQNDKMPCSFAAATYGNPEANVWRYLKPLGRSVLLGDLSLVKIVR
jgi:hypothetical protein